MVRVEGVRRILALVHGLPLDAAVWREERPQWTTEHELLAVNAEVTDRLGHTLLAAWTGKKPRGEPLRIEHPHRHGGRQRRRVTMAELMKGG